MVNYSYDVGNDVFLPKWVEERLYCLTTVYCHHISKKPIYLEALSRSPL